jgi:hypothetical protein
MYQTDRYACIEADGGKWPQRAGHTYGTFPSFPLLVYYLGCYFVMAYDVQVCFVLMFSASQVFHCLVIFKMLIQKLLKHAWLIF